MVKYIHTQKIADDEPIWRYMDFVSFYSLMLDSALFFRRLDHYSDAYEGTIPEETMAAMELHWAAHGHTTKSEFDDLNSKYLPNIDILKMGTLANSWTMSNAESYAMWKIYLRNSSEGVAIKTTAGKLKEALSINKLPIILGQVVYGTLQINELTYIRLATNKRTAYRYENEFRAVIPNQFKQEFLTDGKGIVVPLFETGTAIQVDLEKLFGELYISPFSSSWFYNIIESVVRRLGPPGLKVTVMPSGIKDR